MKLTTLLTVSISIFILVIATFAKYSLAQQMQPRDPFAASKNLIEIKKIPDAKMLSQIEIECSFSDQPIDEKTFRHLISTAKALSVDDPSIATWSYAPFCSVSFLYRDETYHATLFHGGRGSLKLPNGKKGMFDFTLPKTLYVTGDTPPSALKAIQKNHIRDGMTLGQIVKQLGPGWMPPLSGTGIMQWSFDDGSILYAWPEHYTEENVMTFRKGLVRTKSPMWFEEHKLK